MFQRTLKDYLLQSSIECNGRNRYLALFIIMPNNIQRKIVILFTNNKILHNFQRNSNYRQLFFIQKLVSYIIIGNKTHAHIKSDLPLLCIIT